MNFKTNITTSKDEALPVVIFCKKNYQNKKYFTENGPARQFCIVNQLDTSITDYLIILREKKLKLLGINSFLEEPEFGIFLGVNTEGGFVHEHTDITIPNYYHVRLNFLLSKPEQGGIPIIKNFKINLNEGESWINLASEWPHSSTPVLGKKLRIVLSLGALVKIRDFPNNFMYLYDQDS